MKNITLLIFLFTYSIGTINAQLVVTSSTNAVQLVNDFVLSGVTASNVQYTGASNTLGSFSNGNTTNIGLPDGIIMTTGNLLGTGIGNPSSDFATTDNSGAGNSALDAIAGFTTYDASVLEFDLIPSGNVLEFQYVFASEEYNEYVNSSYNDVFGFFITGPDPSGGNYTGQNIATIPGTAGTPVSINNVNNGVASGCAAGPCTNCAYFVDNCNGTSIVYDAFTTVLLAKIDVIASNSYHLQMAVADVSDGVLDSGIFLKAQSMKSYNSSTSIKDVQLNSYLVYTNSLSDQLIINKVNNKEENEILSILNTQGQVIKQVSLQDEKTEFNISDLAKGVYIVKINGNNNSFVKKIIK